MGRREEAVEWLRKGYSPVNIANEMGINIASVMQYLYQKVGEGAILRSDIIFSIDEETRTKIESLISSFKTISWWQIVEAIEKSGKKVNPEEVKIYLKLRNARSGDMYELLCNIEEFLHLLIQRVLLAEYKDDWWEEGISVEDRKKCASRKEEHSGSKSHPYLYTDLIDLKKILEKKWKLFSCFFPQGDFWNKKTLIYNMTKLNSIRNCVMHPVRRDHVVMSDFVFVREFYNQLQPLKSKLIKEKSST